MVNLKSSSRHKDRVEVKHNLESLSYMYELLEKEIKLQSIDLKSNLNRVEITQMEGIKGNTKTTVKRQRIL